ncbi:MAG: hypothetical protein HKO65_09165 [Gemmatimonadetes bacterium]|nr:hypothetical protein [Gemmatimonadota bacterium]NNM05259.1 hypothetical protein [Gemmatimonadota bacterium]
MPDSHRNPEPRDRFVRRMSHGPLVMRNAAATLLCLAVSGCGDKGPTEPDPVTLPDLFGNQLYRSDGSQVGVGTLEGTSIIGIYFASPTCPACLAFSPLLVDAYNQLKTDGRSFEVVLVVNGINVASLSDFMTDSGMPWLAVSPESGRPSALAQRFSVQWVPTLIIIDGTGKIISLAGRDEITQNGPGAYDDWIAAGPGG